MLAEGIIMQLRVKVKPDGDATEESKPRHPLKRITLLEHRAFRNELAAHAVILSRWLDESLLNLESENVRTRDPALNPSLHIARGLATFDEKRRNRISSMRIRALIDERSRRAL
jgi:hypothetical protein